MLSVGSQDRSSRHYSELGTSMLREALLGRLRPGAHSTCRDTVARRGAKEHLEHHRSRYNFDMLLSQWSLLPNLRAIVP